MPGCAILISLIEPFAQRRKGLSAEMHVQNLLAPAAHHLSSNQGQVEDLNRQLDTTR